ncbi:MAG: hypothetical protein IKW59_08575 [Clostridia bacterium]|nr:hypothetical protein [Clostridia bacterium]
MEKENIRRFLRDEAELTGVLFDAYRESERGEVCVTQINARRAKIFKDMCINFLNKNGIKDFAITKDGIQFYGHYKITFRSENANLNGYYKIL